MAMYPFDRQTASFAFPGAALGAMPAEGGADAARADPSMRSALGALEGAGPWRAADSLAYDDVIDPREVRDRLLGALELADARAAEPAEPARHAGIRP
jgi:hypothetical protein